MNENPESAALARKFLEELGEEGPELYQRSMEKAMGNMNRNRDHVLTRFQRMYESIQSEIQPTSVNVSLNPPDQYMKRKTAETERRALQRLIPIRLSEMVLDTTHHGRFIRGTLIVDPFVMSSIQTIFEDENMEVVNLSIYSKKQNNLPLQLKWQYAQEVYKRGLKIMILEPFYKVAMDGTLAIRVDNPNDIVVIESFPTTSLEIKEEANRMFAAQSYDLAIKRYDDALAVLKDLDTYRAIFQNLSLVHLKLNQPEYALQYAIAAVFCGGNAEKAYFRLALALDTLGYKNAALFCCNKVQDSFLARNDKGFKDLYNSLHKSGPPINNLWDDERIVKAISINKPGVRLLGKTTVSELKQLGNDCVQSKLYEQAQVHYEQALLQLEATSQLPLATLMCNKAICSVHLGKFSLGVIGTTCALLLAPFYEKALYNRSECLINLGFMDEAAATIEHTQTILDSDCKKFDELKNRLVNKPSTNKQHDESDEKDGYMGLQQLIQMNHTIDMFGNGKLKNRDIPNFYERYVQTKPWPTAANTSSCKRILQEAYEHGRSSMLELQFFQGMIDDYFIFKRIGSNDPFEQIWYQTAPIGDIRQRPRHTYGLGMIHQNFGNVAQIPQKMEGATCHVAFGFADLQELCIADLSSCSPDTPLKWVGYDMSPYVVAKTLVIIEMMKSGSDSDPVVQVWYSTAWTRETLRLFRKALTTVLTDSSLPESVRVFLLHWQQHDIALSQARQVWLKAKKKTWSQIANWMRECDQLAMCTYSLTGQIQKEAHVGSIVMYAFPDNNERVEDDQDVFETIKMADIVQQCEESSEDCLAAANTLLNKRVSRVMSLMKLGAVTVEARLGVIGIDEDEIIETVRSLQPASMSWSNLCDYIELEDFFGITKACSSLNTTKHFGYSMNWPMEVKGAHTVDYLEEGESFREVQLEDARKHYKEQLSAQIPLSEQYLRHLPITHPLNVVDCMLHARFCQHWVQNNFPVARTHTFSDWVPHYRTTGVLFFNFDATRG